jgi:uncharacterized protein (TIGR02118 family)
MIRLNILYPNTPGSRFDMDYYLGTHMPMSKRLLGDACKGMSIERGIAGATPGAPPTYIVSCHMLFESIDTFMAAWALHGDALGSDIPNYTEVQPVIQFSEPLPFA